jgi:CO/xanthine dehydrogenase Mo-binding subunit
VRRAEVTAENPIPKPSSELSVQQGGVPCLLSRFCQQVIVRDRVRYVGEPIAVVLADNPALAEDSVDAITLDIVELPIVADRYISQRQETLLFEDAGTNLAIQFTAIHGDADAAFRDAEYSRRAHFTVRVTPHYRWNRADCSPNGTPRRDA